MGYALRQSFRQIHRNRAMSIASIFAITAMLLILGIFFSLILNVSQIAESIKGDYNNIEVFMKDNITTTQLQKIKDRVEKWEDVDSVTVRTKKEALNILKERWGDNGYMLDGLRKNPLPNSLILTVSDLTKADAVAEKAQNIVGKEDVKYYKDTVDKLIKITKYIEIAGLIIMVILVIISIVVVANTIKLTVMNRADEISIMRYVGATSGFIRGPFLLEGIFIGLISALISMGIMSVVYIKLYSFLTNELMSMMSIPLVDVKYMLLLFIGIFVVIGVCVGALGSAISIKRFLNR